MNLEKAENISEPETVTTETAEGKSAAEEIVKTQFNVMSVQKTDAPDGMEGDNWYQYIIGKGTSEIQGLKMGTLKGVTAHANSVADDLNERSRGKKTTASVNKKKATPPKPE